MTQTLYPIIRVHITGPRDTRKSERKKSNKIQIFNRKSKVSNVKPKKYFTVNWVHSGKSFFLNSNAKLNGNCDDP